MKRILTNVPILIIALATLYSCHNTRKIKVDNIESLVLDYDSYYPNNYNATFPGKVCAQMKTTEYTCLKNNANFSSSSNVDFNINREKITLVGSPLKFNQSKVPVVLIYEDNKENRVEYNDTLYVNFKASITINAAFADGQNGQKGKDGNQSIAFRDGQEGDPGTSGQHGNPGPQMEVYVWKDSVGMYYFYVSNRTTGYISRLNLSLQTDFTLSANGSDGGNGGNGGDGGNGKNFEVNGSKIKYGGNGGRGGFGGNGGNGGNGGSIRCVIHPSATDFQPFLKFSANGGRGGEMGRGGEGGKPGIAHSTQAATVVGQKGFSGARGISGANGTIQTTVELFDPKGFY